MKNTCACYTHMGDMHIHNHPSVLYIIPGHLHVPMLIKCVGHMVTSRLSTCPFIQLCITSYYSLTGSSSCNILCALYEYHTPWSLIIRNKWAYISSEVLDQANSKIVQWHGRVEKLSLRKHRHNRYMMIWIIFHHLYGRKYIPTNQLVQFIYILFHCLFFFHPTELIFES